MIEIKEFTKGRIDDVIAFEHDLRREEDFWGWEIDDAYRKAVEDSFENLLFRASISFLAYLDGKDRCLSDPQPF